MSEANKNAIRRLIDEVWNRGNLAAADDLFDDNYLHHDAATPEGGRGAMGEKNRATLYRNAFADFRISIEDLMAEGETVTARWSCRGTHKGELNGIAPTGKQIAVTGMSIARFSGGKMVEGWVNWDALGLLQQLGVVEEVGKSRAAGR